MTKRLPPMIEDPSQPPYVRELLQAGRDFKVVDYDVAKGLEKHLAHIATGAPVPPWAQTLQSPGAGAVAAAGGSLVPWVVLPLLTASVVAAVMFGTSEPSAAPGPAAPVAAPQQPTGAAAALAAEPVEAEQPAVDDEASSHGIAPALRGGATVRTAGEVPRARRAARPAKSAPHAGSRASASSAKSAPSAPPTGAAETSALPFKTAAPRSVAEGEGSSHGTSTQSAAAAEPQAPIAIEDPQPAAEAEAAEPPARPQPAPQDDARLEREMAMLAMSQRVLHTDPARALKLARQGEAEFPGSMFTQERQQLLLLALVKLGQVEQAKRLAKPYLARYPKGPFSDRVRRALATGRVEH